MALWNVIQGAVRKIGVTELKWIWWYNIVLIYYFELNNDTT